MTQPFKLILQSIKDSQYLAAKSVKNNEKTCCNYILLTNGLKLKEQLLKKWLRISYSNCTKLDHETIKPNFLENNRISFLENKKIQKSYEKICKEKLVNLSNSITLQMLCDNSVTEGICNCSGTLLVTYLFVAAENELSRYHNFQRERKIWWMRYSADPSRYFIEPFQICRNEKTHNIICKESRSVTVKANLPCGQFDIEYISLVPLYKLTSLNLSFIEAFQKISLIRSVINLDLTTKGLILDASACKTGNKFSTLMLNKILAPYQLLLINLLERSKTVDELTLHLQHVISRIGLRLYSNYIRTNNLVELEKNLIKSDSLGIPYTLVADEEAIKSGILKIRSRDTTLFEVVHISDVPNYLLNIFKQ